MTTHNQWTDECWLPLLRLYMKRPEGVKPMFSRDMVELSLELHVPPQYLYGQMFRLRRPDTPWLRRLVERYAGSPRRLARDVKTAVSETFERDFRPLPGVPELEPVMLVMVLDLYFRLTPATMAVETPEVAELARVLRVKPAVVVGVLRAFMSCDPYLSRPCSQPPAMLAACRDVWQRYGNGEPQELAALAAQLREYFR